MHGSAAPELEILFEAHLVPSPDQSQPLPGSWIEADHSEVDHLDSASHPVHLDWLRWRCSRADLNLLLQSQQGSQGSQKSQEVPGQDQQDWAPPEVCLQPVSIGDNEQ